MTADRIEITQTRSLIGAQPSQRRTLRALGLRGIRQTVVHVNSPEIRGMLAKVAHMVEIRAEGQREPTLLEPGQEPPPGDDTPRGGQARRTSRTRAQEKS